MDGSPIQFNMQMDAEEFFNNLMNNMSDSLKSLEQVSSTKQTFGGTSLQEIVSTECSHKSEIKSEFFSLGVEVKNSSNLHQSLKKLAEKEILTGENKYDCNQCAKKVSAFKRESLKTLPNYLFIVLKRITFDLETGNTVKLNNYFEFPTLLNLREYSTDYLSAQSSRNIGGNVSDEYYKYTIKGIVIHVGNADSGHYYSVIK